MSPEPARASRARKHGILKTGHFGRDKGSVPLFLFRRCQHSRQVNAVSGNVKDVRTANSLTQGRLGRVRSFDRGDRRAETLFENRTQQIDFALGALERLDEGGEVGKARRAEGGEQAATVGRPLVRGTGPVLNDGLPTRRAPRDGSGVAARRSISRAEVT